MESDRERRVFEARKSYRLSNPRYVSLYDLRSSKPTLVKDHQYGLPVVNVHFHRPAAESSQRLVISADARVVKAWDARDGAVACNIESSAPMHSVTVAPDGPDADSGLLFCAGEQARVMAYYAPCLGRAPKWCSFLDSLTEELEETGRSTYDDFRFVSKDEVEDLGASAFIGTPQLRAYLHGYFLDAKLYRRLAAVATPRAYDDYREKKVAAALAAKKASRIRKADVGPLPAVNAGLAQRLLDDGGGDAAAAAANADVDDSGDDVPATAPAAAKKKAKRPKPANATNANPLGDDRFASMFQDPRFQVDTFSPEFAFRHPKPAPPRAEAPGDASYARTKKKKKRKA